MLLFAGEGKGRSEPLKLLLEAKTDTVLRPVPPGLLQCPSAREKCTLWVLAPKVVANSLTVHSGTRVFQKFHWFLSMAPRTGTGISVWFCFSSLSTSMFFLRTCVPMALFARVRRVRVPADG